VLGCAVFSITALHSLLPKVAQLVTCPMQEFVTNH
jgi:hypothetical protein